MYLCLWSDICIVSMFGSCESCLLLNNFQISTIYYLSIGGLIF